MDEQEILQHLLSLEADAADLVSGAQAASDKRISEGEKQNRERYEEAYAREVTDLEDQYIKNLNVIKENYQKQLEEYRDSLNARETNPASFSLLAEKYLFSEGM